MHRDDGVQPSHAAFGNEHAAHRRNHPLQGLAKRRSDRDAAEQAMLACIARQNRLIDRILTVCDTTDGTADAGAIIDVKTVKFRDRPLLDQIGGIEIAFKDDLGLRRHLEIHRLAFHQLQRLAEEATDIVIFVVAETKIELRAEQHSRVIADGDCDLELVAACTRLFSENVEMMVLGNAGHHPSPALQP